LKSAVINYLYQRRQKGEPYHAADLAASFQAAAVAVLVDKTVTAAREYNATCVLMAGGVAANSQLRREMRERLARSIPGVPLYYPPPAMCTDNAAMIAAAAYPRYLRGEFAPLDLNAVSNLAVQNTGGKKPEAEC
jgi:N6-L-threonylcarbamoyladenine synthase